MLTLNCDMNYVPCTMLRLNHAGADVHSSKFSPPTASTLSLGRLQRQTADFKGRMHIKPERQAAEAAHIS
eukprot:scaffold2743_cov21-Tisochrysis_lutea.AAC.3